MKKGLKIFLIIIAVIIVLVGAVAVWQWENISAVIYSVRYSEEELAELEKENQEKLDSVVMSLDVMPRELDEEEKAALESGQITEQDAVEISLGTTTLEKKIEYYTKNNITPGKSEQNTASVQNPTTGNGRVSEIIAKLYVLKSSFISQLNGLAGQAAAEYASTPKEKRTASWKASKISKYIGRAGSLEAQCDARVEGVISELKAELERTGGDTSIIGAIRSAYASEKQAKKAYYMNKYLN